MPIRTLVLATATTLVLAACGTASPERATIQQTMLAYATGSISKTPVPLQPDEYRAYDGAGYLWLGDTSDNSAYRAVVGFSLSALPPAAEIESATLTLGRIRALGTPFADLGALMVESIHLAGSIDASDYESAGEVVGSLVREAGDETIDVTDAVREAMIRGSADFRLRFQRGTDSGLDTDITFVNDRADTAVNAGLDLSVPVLQVHYRE